MPLTQEQVAIIGKAIRAKGLKPCPVCSQFKWFVDDAGIVQLSVAAAGLGNWRVPLPTINVLPNAVLICGNCGNTQLINLFVLGVAEQFGFHVEERQ